MVALIVRRIHPQCNPKFEANTDTPTDNEFVQLMMQK